MAVNISINGEYLDIPDESWMSMSVYPANIIQGYAQITYTTSLIVKKTINNLKILQFPNVFNYGLDIELPYKGKRAVLSFNGILMEAIVYIESIDEESIKLQINAGDFLHLEELKNKPLNKIRGNPNLPKTVVWNASSFRDGELNF